MNMITTSIVGDVVVDDGDLKIMTNTGLVNIAPVPSTTVTANTIMTGASSVTIGKSFDMEDFLDEHIMNKITVNHKVSEHELLKLREVSPTYADEIKEEIAKNAAREVAKRMTYTKRTDKDADVHHFIGRVWVFTESELKEFIEAARNV